MFPMLFDFKTITQALRCKCPACQHGDLYKPGLSLDLRDKCGECGLDLSKNDSADGPAVLLIFLLGFLFVPVALFVDARFEPALWVHALVWGPLLLGATLGGLRPLKSYVIALQYKHTPDSWT